jgi:hypothetical protein
VPAVVGKKKIAYLPVVLLGFDAFGLTKDSGAEILSFASEISRFTDYHRTAI